MRKAFVVLFAIAALTSSVWADSAPRALIAGAWQCQPERPSSNFPGGWYQINLVPPTKTQPESLVLRHSSGQSVTGYLSGLSYIIRPKSKLAYMDLSTDDPSYRKMELSVSVRVDNSSYLPEGFKCMALREPVIQTSKVVKFECATDKAFSDYGITKVRFGATFLNNPRHTNIVSVSGNEDPIDVHPKRSPLFDLNSNLEVVRTPKGLGIHGDADGFYLVRMFLYGNSGFRRGYAQVEDLSGSAKSDYSTVTCSVSTLK